MLGGSLLEAQVSTTYSADAAQALRHVGTLLTPAVQDRMRDGLRAAGSAVESAVKVSCPILAQLQDVWRSYHVPAKVAERPSTKDELRSFAVRQCINAEDEEARAAVKRYCTRNRLYE